MTTQRPNGIITCCPGADRQPGDYVITRGTQAGADKTYARQRLFVSVKREKRNKDNIIAWLLALRSQVRRLAVVRLERVFQLNQLKIIIAN